MEEGATLYGRIGFCGWWERRINYYFDFLVVKFEMPIRYAAEDIWGISWIYECGVGKGGRRHVYMLD